MTQVPALCRARRRPMSRERWPASASASSARWNTTRPRGPAPIARDSTTHSASPATPSTRCSTEPMTPPTCWPTRPGAMGDDLAGIEGRLKLLEAERDILDTLARYGQTIDRGPDAEWLDCFTEDAAWENVTGVADRVRRYEGRDQLAAFIAGHSKAPEATHLHLMVEPRVAVDGDAARVESYWVRL